MVKKKMLGGKGGEAGGGARVADLSSLRDKLGDKTEKARKEKVMGMYYSQKRRVAHKIL